MRFFAPIFLVLSLTIMALPSQAANHSRYAPVTKYVAANSVLGSYYTHYVDRYGKRFANSKETFRSFCRILRTSDLLAAELIQTGIPTDQVYSILRGLETTDLTSPNSEAMRRSLLAIDYTLESIEASLHQSHRSEFRREVLAEVPSLSFHG